MPKGYLGPNIWDNSTKIVTQISSDSDNTYASDTSTAPKDPTKVIKMATDQYPTGVTFSGCPMGNHTETTRKVKLSISNKEGTIFHELANVSVDHGNWAEHQTGGNNGETIIVRELHRGTEPISSWNKTDQGTDWIDLKGAYLAIMKEGPKEIGLYWYDSQVTVNITTEYTANTVTLTHNVGGTVSFDETDDTVTSASMLRGATKRIYIKPARGYAIKTSTKSGGTWSVVSMSGGNAVYEFTMSSPAQDITINVEFKQIIFNITKNISVSNAGTITGPDEATAGDTVTVSQTTNSEYRFDGWTIKAGDADVDYTTSNSGSTATFTMPPQNVTVTGRYTQHAITWTGAGLSAVQNSTDVTLTYKGVAKDNLFRPLTYWIHVIEEGQRTITEIPRGKEPNATEQTIVLQNIFSSADEHKEVQFILVAGNGPLRVSGASLSMYVGAVNRTVKYFTKKHNRNGEWVECVPYFCPGFVRSETVDDVPTYDHYLRIGYAGTYSVPFTPVVNSECSYQVCNLTDDYIDVYFKKNGNKINDITSAVEPGATMSLGSSIDFDTIELEFTGKGFVEIRSSSYDLGSIAPSHIANKPIWNEVEPHYYTKTDGWQLCAFA